MFQYCVHCSCVFHTYLDLLFDIVALNLEIASSQCLDLSIVDPILVMTQLVSDQKLKLDLLRSWRITIRDTMSRIRSNILG